MKLYTLLLLALTANVARSADTPPPPAGRPDFDVRTQGAVGDGITLDTVAIQRAIDACGAAGGGRVLFPSGRFLSGTVRLRSNVELHLLAGARLVGTTNLTAYTGFSSSNATPKLPQSRWNHALIIGENLKNIAFTGPGVIDGNKVFDPRGEERMRGPHLVQLGNCQNVTLRGLTLRDAANYAFFIYHCEHVRVTDATFEGGWDGVHFRGWPDAWNRDLRITSCQFFTGDDSIAGHYLEDGIIENCVLNSSCNGVRLIGPARRLTFTRCGFYGPGLFAHRSSGRTNMLAALCLQPSGWDRQPGPMEDVTIRDCTMKDVSCAFHIAIRPGNTAKNLLFERILATGVYRAAASVESWGERTFAEVSFRDVAIEYTGGGTATDAQIEIKQPGVDARPLPAWGFFVRNAIKVTLDHVTLTTRQPDARPVLRAEDVETLRIIGCQFPLVTSGEPFQLKDVVHFEQEPHR